MVDVDHVPFKAAKKRLSYTKANGMLREMKNMSKSSPRLCAMPMTEMNRIVLPQGNDYKSRRDASLCPLMTFEDHEYLRLACILS